MNNVVEKSIYDKSPVFRVLAQNPSVISGSTLYMLQITQFLTIKYNPIRKYNTYSKNSTQLRQDEQPSSSLSVESRRLAVFRFVTRRFNWGVPLAIVRIIVFS